MPIKPRPIPHKKPSTSFKLSGELADVVSQINSTHGMEVERALAKQPVYYDHIPTGIMALDLGLAGGWQVSRGSMLYGEKSSGKSTVAMKTCISVQQMYPDKVPVWIDLEGTFDETWFRKLGGDLERFVKIEPETGENAVDIADAVLRSEETSVLVTDSIAMLTPTKELDNSSEDSMPGIHARLIGTYLRKVNLIMLKERHRRHMPLVLHINQFRMKIGLAFGDPRTLPGGKALEFMTSQQAEMRNKEHIHEKTGIVEYNEHNFKITKDKTGGRVREGKFKLCRDPASNNNLPEGFINQVGTMFELGSRVGLAQGKFEFVGYGSKKSYDDWNQFFVQEPEALARCMSGILTAYRKEWGLAVA